VLVHGPHPHADGAGVDVVAVDEHRADAGQNYERNRVLLPCRQSPDATSNVLERLGVSPVEWKRTVELRDDARPLLGALLGSLGFDLDAVVRVNRLESDNGFIFMQ
jgi:hypothetical protein